MIAATHTKNYFCNQQFDDWLDASKRPKEISNFTRMLFRQGAEFEKKVFAHLSAFSGIKFHTPKGSRDPVQGAELIRSAAHPVLTNVFVADEELQWRGEIDLLVRRDVFHKVFPDTYLPPTSLPPETDSIKYVVIDVKFSTLYLNAKGTGLLNKDMIPAYKSQIYFYTHIVNRLTGSNTSYAYLLGRKLVGRDGSTYYTRLGFVDFTDTSIPEDTHKAVAWVRSVREWAEQHPKATDEEFIKEFGVYPNTGCRYSFYTGYKRKMLQDTQDVTMVWRCGDKNRQKMRNAGCPNTKWTRVEDVYTQLGLSGQTARIVEKMIHINKPACTPESGITPVYSISMTPDACKVLESRNEVFVDFETIPNVFDVSYPNTDADDFVFMIGVWYNNAKYNTRQSGDWKYRSFLAQTPDRVSERKLLMDFKMWLHDKFGNDVTCWYWYAEKFFWNNACNRCLIDPSYLNVEFKDLYRVVRDSELVIKGAFSFGLKDIAKALHKHSIIDTQLPQDSLVSDGMGAGLDAYMWYSDHSTPDSVMHAIRNYNRFDVKVLKDIIDFLRTHV